MGGMISELQQQLIPAYTKSNGALNVPLLKTNKELCAILYGISCDIGSPGKFGIVFQHIKRGTFSRPTCECGKLTNWKSEISWYKEFCSTKCSANSAAKKQKIEDTCIAKYGVNNPSKLPAVRLSAQTTMLDKYGAAHACHVQAFEDKRHATNLEKYGCKEAILADIVKEKSNISLIKKYGEHPFKHNSIKVKKENTCLERYGVTVPAKSAEILAKMRSSTLKHHGVENISHANIHVSVLQNINDINWLITENNTKSISHIASDLGLTVKTISGRFSSVGLAYKKHASSIFETEIIEFISDNSISMVSNNRTLLSGKELDIFIPSLNLAIECNGSYWHSELNGRDNKYHLSKTTECNKVGIRLMHIWEHDWNLKRDIVKSRILTALQGNTKIFARKCLVVELDFITVKDFLNSTHIQGSCASLINYGLMYGTQLVAVMTFGKSRFNKNIQYELLRYSSLLSTTVVGGASKLFSYFVKTILPTSVISYSDIGWNTGKLYELLGFKHSHTTKPSYKYTHDYKKFANRVEFQKHKLHNKVDCFDDKCTEWENMQNNGYDRIWDCGTKVFNWGK